MLSEVLNVDDPFFYVLFLFFSGLFATTVIDCDLVCETGGCVFVILCVVLLVCVPDTMFSLSTIPANHRLSLCYCHR